MNIANKITTFRFIAIPFFVAAILYYSPERDFLRFVALGIFMLAVISDGLDGYFARSRRELTKAGSILDPLADKLLLTAGLICIYVKDSFPAGISLPLWFVLLVISRDFLIVLGSGVVFLTHTEFEVEPSKLGKYTVFSQMATIIAVLLQFKYSFVLWSIAAILTILSGLGYLKRGQKLMVSAESQNKK